MDCNAMVEFFKIKCQELANDCERAVWPEDVDSLDGNVCEMDGMRKMLQAGNDGNPLSMEVLKPYYAAHAAFTRAHNRICYDPVTGNPLKRE